MDAKAVLDVVLREAYAYAYGWRLDWSDFDGRTLLRQISDLKKWAEQALEQEDMPEYTQGTEFLERRGDDDLLFWYDREKEVR